MKKLESEINKLYSKIYWLNLSIALLAITYDLTLQEVIREQQAQGLKLPELLNFLHQNFAGDIGNAFSFVFGISTIIEIINQEIQQQQNNENLKKVFEIFSALAPYLLAAFFFLASIDGETSQQIFKWGTPDKNDLYGAFFGIMVAFASIIKFKKAIYPKE